MIAVNHNAFKDYDESFFKNILTNDGIIVDIKGAFRNKISDITYWSL